MRGWSARYPTVAVHPCRFLLSKLTVEDATLWNIAINELYWAPPQLANPAPRAPESVPYLCALQMPDGHVVAAYQNSEA